MKFIKISAISIFLAFSAGTFSTAAFAEQTATATGAAETVSHLEKARSEIQNGDFNTALVHLKAARNSAEKLSGDEAAVKKAYAALIQSQIKTKLGDKKVATDELDKTIALYKAL